VGESQRNLWLQAGHLQNIQIQSLSHYKLHIHALSLNTVTVATLHLLIHTHVGCALGIAIEPASVLTVDAIKKLVPRSPQRNRTEQNSRYECE